MSDVGTFGKMVATMATKLSENDHKEHWLNFTVGDMRRRLTQERAELDRAHQSGRLTGRGVA